MESDKFSNDGRRGGEKERQGWGEMNARWMGGWDLAGKK